jgi:hypothetical protein
MARKTGLANLQVISVKVFAQAGRYQFAGLIR